MILVDTSVWIQHFRRTVSDLSQLLSLDQVVTHSVVLGELASGNIKDRGTTLADLRRLPCVGEARSWYCLDFIEQHRLYGLGLGWNDLQLLAAAVLNGTPLWAFDGRLNTQAQAFGVAWAPPTQ